MHIILGLLGVVVGTLFVMKSEWLLQNFGKVPWAEEHLGADGGSRLFYKLIGLAIIIIGFLGMIGLLGGLIIGIFGSLFRGLAPQ
jgi:hypothetical protein